MDTCILISLLIIVYIIAIVGYLFIQFNKIDPLAYGVVIGKTKNVCFLKLNHSGSIIKCKYKNRDINLGDLYYAIRNWFTWYIV